MTLVPFPEHKRRPPRALDWLVLPLAPRANSRIRFAAPAGSPMPVDRAVAWIGELTARGRRIHGIDIRGPGDALAEPHHLFQAVENLRGKWPDLAIRITTIGLGSAALAARLAEAGVDEVILQVDAVHGEIMEQLYAWIRPGRRTIPLAEVTGQLASEQKNGAEALVRAGLGVRIMTTVYPGINDNHLGEIAASMARAGAASISVLPFTATPAAMAAEKACPPSCDTRTLDRARAHAAAHLPLEAAPSTTGAECGAVPRPLRDEGLPRPTAARPHVAVASSNGMDIDLHLGEADRLLIYGPREDGLACLLEARPVPPVPPGVSRWQNLAGTCLHDCFAVLVANAGEAPKKALRELGIRVMICSDNIEGTVDVLFGGGKKKRNKETKE